VGKSKKKRDTINKYDGTEKTLGKKRSYRKTTRPPFIWGMAKKRGQKNNKVPVCLKRKRREKRSVIPQAEAGRGGGTLQWSEPSESGSLSKTGVREREED